MAVYGTRADLIGTCLSELKVTSYGTPPTAEEYEAVDQRLDGILGELSARNIASVGNPDEVPSEIMIPLGQAIARQLGSTFSVMADEIDKMFQQEAHPLSPENRLRAIYSARAVTSPAQPDYF